VRILQVCNKFPYPPKDGGVIAKFSILKGFYLTGQEVTLAAINTSKHFTDIEKLPHEIKQMAKFHDVYVNTDIKPIPALINFLFSKKPYTASRFISKEFTQKLIEILTTQEFDVIHLEGLYVCPYIDVIRKHSKALISYRAHNVEFEIWDRLWRETPSFFKRIYLRNLANRVERFEKNQINKYDTIVPITQRDADVYEKLGNRKPYFVAPTGIFAKDFNSHTFKGEQSIYHIGGLDWAPNQQGIIWFIDNCWHQIKAKYPKLRFRIAGRNAPSWFIQKLSVPGVEFVGEVESSEEFMNANGIMIVPLLAGSGMRIKIIEGLAYGKVIVSTSIGAEGIPAIHNKDICIANTADSFIASLDNVLSDNELYTSIEKNATNFVKQNFDNYKITHDLIDFYQQHVS